MMRSSLPKFTALTVLFFFLNCGASAQAEQKFSGDQIQAKRTLQRYIELRLHDADWKEYSRFITWPDEPGWDCKWVVLRYTVGRAIEARKKITIPVTYTRLALFCSDFDFKPDPKSVTIRYELVRGPQSWKVNSPIPDYPEIGTKSLLKLLRRVAGSGQEEPERRAEAAAAARKLEAALNSR